MTYNLDISDEAHEDLRQIIGYIAIQLKNPPAARNLKSDILELYNSLSTHPEMYAFARDERMAAKGFRVAAVEKYLVVYKVNKSSKEVVIHNVFYGARAYQELL